MNKLIEKIVSLKKELGVTEEVLAKELEAVQTKANEVVHTTNTGYWKELIPVNVLTDTILNNIPNYMTFMNSLPGFHGNQMGASVKVPVIGEVWFAKGNGEWTTWAGAIAQGTNRLATWEVTITQIPLIVSVDVSKKELNHSIVDVESKIMTELSKSFARTMESMVINGDIVTAATGNVNSDDQAPATTFATTGWAEDHRIYLDGLRKTCLAWTSAVDYVDVWTLDFDDFITSRALLGDYSYNLEDLMLLFNGATYNKTLTIAEFKNQYQNGIASTAVDGKLQNKLAWVQYAICRDFGKTEADGKMSATPASNTKWGFIYMTKWAIQYGYGQEIEIDVIKIPWKGIQIIGTMEFGFAIANKKAWVTDPAVILAINATV